MTEVVLDDAEVRLQLGDIMAEGFEFNRGRIVIRANHTDPLCIKNVQIRAGDKLITVPSLFVTHFELGGECQVTLDEAAGQYVWWTTKELPQPDIGMIGRVASV